MADSQATNAQVEEAEGASEQEQVQTGAAEAGGDEAQSDSKQEAEGKVEAKVETKPDATLTTVPKEPEKDLDWYKTAYSESTAEALRLKAQLEEDKKAPKQSVTERPPALSPAELYLKQKQDEEIGEAFTDIQNEFPQVNDQAEYKRFTTMANTFGRTILESEGRLASPKELYAKTAIALGWTDNAEKLGAAIKSSVGAPKVGGATGKAVPSSKVTDAMIAANRKWYPEKTDAQIREELEPYVQ